MSCFSSQLQCYNTKTCWLSPKDRNCRRWSLKVQCLTAGHVPRHPAGLENPPPETSSFHWHTGSILWNLHLFSSICVLTVLLWSSITANVLFSAHTDRIAKIEDTWQPSGSLFDCWVRCWRTPLFHAAVHRGGNEGVCSQLIPKNENKLLTVLWHQFRQLEKQ